MIKHFAHKGLEQFFLTGSKAGIQAAISADMAVRLSILLSTSSSLWAGMQLDYDLWQPKQKKHDFVIPLSQSLA